MSQATEPERLRLEIGGMTCASCAARIERKLNKRTRGLPTLTLVGTIITRSRRPISGDGLLSRPR